jgi:predicted dithiol-disulfide oxidoreductase (DUF899 family)
VTDYDVARDALRDAELALMQQREAVAVLRRDLPPGPVAQDYVFDEVGGQISLDELVGDRPLVIYHFMFGGPMAAPCPGCSMWADGWNAVVEHIDQNVDFAMVSQGMAAENVELATGHDWQNLRWLSAAENSFKLDYGSADAEGNQWPFITVFERDGDGVRLSYSASAHISGDHWRGVDLLSPVWHVLDLTRQGRGEFMPSLDYSS